ncbi:MAG: DUF2848 family protein [Trebonia sp.]
MTAPVLDVLGDNPRELTLAAETELVVAGYTGRDVAAVKHHIDELAAIGVAPPLQIPMVYRYPLGLLTTDPDVVVPSADTSGEAEPVLIRQAGAWYLGVGSDHTDRGIERESVERSKAVCPKPVSGEVVALAGDPSTGDLDAEWDAIELRSWAGGRIYQSAGLGSMRPPSDLLPTVLAELPAGADLVVFCGTVPLIGTAFSYAADWKIELRTGGATLRSSYSLKIS